MEKSWQQQAIKKFVPLCKAGGVDIRPEETLDSLFQGRLRVIQAKKGYRFSLDAILLARFAEAKKGERAADLGTGSGVVALALAFLNPWLRVVGLEVDRVVAERAIRTLELNSLRGRVEIVHGDIRSVREIFPPESYDLVVSNPPYRRLKSGRPNPHPERYIARHEVKGSLLDFLRAGSFLLKRKGRISLVYPVSRTVDLLAEMRKVGVEPKKARFVHSRQGLPASLVLVEGIKGGRGEVSILPPLVIYAEGSRYTEEVAAMLDSPQVKS